VLASRRRGEAGLLSGGQQQMLAIGRALMARPKLLLLDEPSLGLAPRLVEEVMMAVQRIRDTGVAILLVEQNAHAALEISDRGYVLERGSVRSQGTASELMSSDLVREAYLGV
jgi:branched-chain amino acid transport system ATP-binding protein